MGFRICYVLGDFVRMGGVLGGGGVAPTMGVYKTLEGAGTNHHGNHIPS